jgi:hypothetical protein
MEIQHTQITIPTQPHPTSTLNPRAEPFIPSVTGLPAETTAHTNVSPAPTIATRWRTLLNYSNNYHLSYQQPPHLAATLSDSNLKTNVPWGNMLSCPKPKDTFRLYSQNINGLKLDDTGGELSTISDFINTYQCDIVGFLELNLDVSKYKVKKIISNTLQKSLFPSQFHVH